MVILVVYELEDLDNISVRVTSNDYTLQALDSYGEVIVEWDITTCKRRIEKIREEFQLFNQDYEEAIKFLTEKFDMVRTL